MDGEKADFMSAQTPLTLADVGERWNSIRSRIAEIERRLQAVATDSDDTYERLSRLHKKFETIMRQFSLLDDAGDEHLAQARAEFEAVLQRHRINERTQP